MVLMAIFTTNAINIFAGINGLEAGQALVIALAVLGHNVIELNGSQAVPHFFSITLMVPFIATTCMSLPFSTLCLILLFIILLSCAAFI